MPAKSSVVSPSKATDDISQVEVRGSTCCSVRREDGRSICVTQPVGVSSGSHQLSPVLSLNATNDVGWLLSRASTLRTYAGDTSLPGGKWEPRDRSIEWTAVSNDKQLFQSKLSLFSEA